MEYRLTRQQLWDILEGWDKYVPGKTRLVACGGTALTVQSIKPSTKDVDFLVPEEGEYKYKALLRTIEKLGYQRKTGSGWARGEGFIFDLFMGKRVFVNELLESSLLPGNHIPIKRFKKIEVMALNDHDLIISKMFRGTSVDIDDCKRLIEARGEGFDLDKLKARYEETASYDTNPDKVMGNLEILLDRLGKD